MADSYESDPDLRISFSPAAIREHFEGSGREEEIRRLSDEALAEAAGDVLSYAESLWDVYGSICGEIVRQAEPIEAKGSEAQPLEGSQ